MLGQDLPPIGAKLTGDVADLLAKIEIVREQIKALKRDASSSTNLKLGTDLNKALDDFAKKARSGVIQKAIDDAMKNTNAPQAGDSAGKQFVNAMRNAIKKEKINVPNWLPLVGLGMGVLPPALTGLAGVLGGIGTAGLAAAAGLGALGMSALEVLGPVKQAFTTIDKLTTTNAIQANATALQTWLRAGGAPIKLTSTGKVTAASAAAQAQQQALGAGLGFLTKPNVNWYTMTKKQQQALVVAAQSTTGMPTSEKAQISALMQERQAYIGLNKAQQGALFEYTQFDNAMVKAQDKSQPQVLALWAAGLKTIIPLFQYLHPLAVAAANALMPLIKEIGAGFKTAGFKDFMAQLIKLSGISIKGFGQSLIDVAKGLGNIFTGIAKSGLASSMVQDVVKMAGAFAKWTGGSGFTTFLAQMKQDAPIVVGLLSKLFQILGHLILSLSGGLGTAELKGLSLLAGGLLTLTKIPGIGAFLYNMAALVLITSKFGSIKLMGAAFDLLYKSLGKVILLNVGKMVGSWLGLEMAGKGVGEVWGGIGGKIGSGIKDGIAWMATGIKNAVIWVAKMIWSGITVAASWIASAVSAAAAWVAANATMILVSGGLVLLLGAIVFGVIELYKHWSTVWAWIRSIAKDAWNFIYNGMGKYLLVLLGPVGLIALGVIELYKHWNTVWGGIKNVAKDAWEFIWSQVVSPMINVFTKTLPNAFGTAARLIKDAWNALKNDVLNPVQWVIDHVINGLIDAFDWITSKIGLGRPIGAIHPMGLAQGGRITSGTGPTSDNVLVRVSKGETVVSAADSAVLAPTFGAMGVPGYATGGIPAGPAAAKQIGKQRGTSAVGPGTGSGFLGKIADIGKITAAIFSGNTVALSNAISSLIGGGVGGATQELGKILTAIPAALLKDVAKYLIGQGGSANLGAIVKFAETFIGKVPYVWGGTSPSGWDCSGFVEYVYRHFGINPPRTSEEQFGWVRHVATPVSGGLAFFAGSDGTKANPGHVGIVVNPNLMVDAYGTGFGTRFNTIQGSSGAISGYGVPPNGAIIAGTGGVGGGPGVQAYRNTMASVLAMLHQPSRDVGIGLAQMQTESGGNMFAVNRSDSNWLAGHPSVGLMQVIAGTYGGYGAPKFGYPSPMAYGVSENAMANTYAGMNYAVQRYGSDYSWAAPGLGWTGVLGHGHGYAGGTSSAMPGLSWVGENGPELVKFHGGEQVYPGGGRGGGQTAGRGGRGPINIYIRTNEINPVMHAAHLGFELARRSA